MGRLIGTSLSHTVSDIVAGNIRIEDIAMVVSGTRIEDIDNIEEWVSSEWGRSNTLLLDPHKFYERREEWVRVVTELWESGRVVEGRSMKRMSCVVGNGVLGWPCLQGEDKTCWYWTPLVVKEDTDG